MQGGSGEQNGDVRESLGTLSLQLAPSLHEQTRKVSKTKKAHFSGSADSREGSLFSFSLEEIKPPPLQKDNNPPKPTLPTSPQLSGKVLPEESKQKDEKLPTLPSFQPNNPVLLSKMWKWVITVCYMVSFLVLGGVIGSLGPILPDLQSNTHASDKAISFAFTSRSIGYLVGSLVAGKAYDTRLPGHLLNGLALIVMIIGLALQPVVPWFWLMIIVTLALGFGGGFIDTGVNTLVVWLWGSDVDPYMQACHFSFGAGAFLAPIVIGLGVQWVDKVEAGVWLITGIGAVAGIASLFIIKKSPSTKEEEEANKLGWRQKIVVILVSGFLFLYVGAEVAFGGWIYTFSLRKGISKSDAYYLNSCFWGTLTLGRLLGVPVVTKVSPSVMIIVDMIGCIASVIIMLIWPDNHVVLWIGTAGLGFFMATTFPSAISLPGSLNIKVSGLDTSFFVMGASLGELVLPVLVGLLFQTFGVQILDYILIIDFVAALVLFILIIGYIKILKPGGAAPVQDIILTGVEVNPEEQKLLNPVDEDHSDQEEAQMEQDYDTDDYFSSDEDNNTV